MARRKPSAERSKDELHELARQRDIAGRSSMSKHDLIEALTAISPESGSDEVDRSPTSGRSVWSGYLSFGLVSIPVALYSAVEDRSIRIPDFEVGDAPVAAEDQVTMAGELIEHLRSSFEPARYRDTYRERLEEAIESKLAEKEIELVPEQPEAAEVVDLMDVLRRSVEETRRSASPGPVRRPLATRFLATQQTGRWVRGRRASLDPLASLQAG